MTAPAYVPIPEIITAKAFVIEVGMVVQRAHRPDLTPEELIFALIEAHEPYLPRSGSLLPAIAEALYQVTSHPTYTGTDPMATVCLTIMLALQVDHSHLTDTTLVVMR